MKNFVARIIIVFTVMMSFLSYSQELPEVIPPSPTVANLMQFEEVPVSYYTGQPNISIPMYSKALSGDLGVNISLSYNTQGVRINNISGWTGTSWSLNAGGVVSRTVRGEPDEITKSNSSTIKTGIYHLDDYWNYSTLSDSLKVKFNYLVVGDSGDKYDNKPDLYQFNFMGHSGRFILLKEGNALVPKFITKSSNYDITFTHDSDFIISSFKIIDTKGYVYTFDVVENSQTTPFTGSTAQGLSVGNVSASSENFNYWANTSWHLSKVETSNGEALVTITYQNSDEDYVASASRTSSTISNASSVTSSNGPTITDFNGFVASTFNQGMLEPKETVSYQSINTITKKVQKIAFTRDSIEIRFDVKQNYDHPETNGAVLEKIRIVDASDPNNIIENKSYQLTYVETTDTSLSPPNKRLWLTKITETAGSIDHDYNLDYNTKEDLPGFNKDDIRGDSWGYYSGIDAGLLSCASVGFSESIIKTGLLKSIEYPTGGVKEFDFEHNSYSYFQDQLIGYDDYMSNPRNSSSTSETGSFNHQNTNISNIPVLVDTVILDYDQDIYISSSLTGATTGTSAQVDNYRLQLTQNGTDIGGVIELDESCFIIRDVPSGTYQLELRLSGNITNDSYVVAGDTTIDYITAVTNPDQEMIGGGVRIREIRFKDKLTDLFPKKSIKYAYKDETNDSLSSGVIDSKADRLQRQYLLNTNRWTFADAGEVATSFIVRNIKYDVIEKAVNVELTQGSYVGYRHVKAYETGNGFSTYSYTSPYDYPSHFQVFDFEQPRPKENLDYKRGLLLRSRVFNQDSLILKETSYLDANDDPNYEFDETLLFNDKTVFKPNCEWIYFYSDYDLWIVGTINNQTAFPGNSGPHPNCGAFSLDNQDFNAGWAKLKGTTTKDYFYNGNTTLIKESRQEFLYNTNNYQISQQDTYYDEAGVEQHMQNKYYYPVGTSLNSNTTAIKNQLVSLNKVNEVLETESFKNGVKLNETQNIYDEFHTDLVLPQQVNVGKGNDTPEFRIEFKRYDTYGNPLEVSKVDGIPISYIWGYNQTLPVAKLIGVSFSQIETVMGNNFDAGSGSLSSTQISSLKSNFTDAQIATYEYDPMVGITKMTDARNYSMTYHYDEFNRLLYVKDKDGNILSENEYNYKNQY